MPGCPSWTDLLFTLLRLSLLRWLPTPRGPLLDSFWALTLWLGCSPLDDFLTLLMLPRSDSQQWATHTQLTSSPCLGSGYTCQADLPQGCAPHIAQVLMLHARMPSSQNVPFAPLWTTAAPLFLRIYTYHRPLIGSRTQLSREEERRGTWVIFKVIFSILHWIFLLLSFKNK